MSTNLLELGINATDYACLPEMNGISDELRDLLSGMLHPTISERSSLEDVLVSDWSWNDFIEMQLVQKV